MTCNQYNPNSFRFVFIHLIYPKISRIIIKRKNPEERTIIHARVADAAIRGRFTAFAVGTRRTSAEEVAEKVDAVGVV